MKCLLLFLSLCAAGIVSAQPDSLWCHLYGATGDEYLTSVMSTADGGYILGGSTNSYGAGAYDFWMLKTAANGDTEWCRTYGGPLNDYGGNVGRTSDGGYFMTGYSSSFGAGDRDYRLIKTTANGDTLWTRTFGGTGTENVYWGLETADSGFILAGESNSLGSHFRVWVVKVGADGDTMWSRTLSGQVDAGATYVAPTADGAFVVTGVIRPLGGGNGDFLLVKIAANGDSLWSHRYGTSVDEIPWCVRQTLDGGYVMVGASTRSNGFTDVLLVKTNADGDSLWSLTYGEQVLNEKGFSVLQASDSGYVIAGESGEENGGVLLVRTDSRGTVLWSRAFGGAAEEIGYDIQATADGGYVIAGGTYSYGAGGADAWLVKTGADPAGVPEPVAPGPLSYRLGSYPNPFNPTTTLAFELPKAEYLSLRVFDVLGREIAVLQEGMSEAGTHRVTFDGGNLPSGIYFARLEAGAFTQTRKLMLLK
jgi:hypothetical protein